MANAALALIKGKPIQQRTDRAPQFKRRTWVLRSNALSFAKFCSIIDPRDERIVGFALSPVTRLLAYAGPTMLSNAARDTKVGLFQLDDESVNFPYERLASDMRKMVGYF
jgi:hypothetical protein